MSKGLIDHFSLPHRCLPGHAHCSSWIVRPLIGRRLPSPISLLMSVTHDLTPQAAAGYGAKSGPSAHAQEPGPMVSGITTADQAGNAPTLTPDVNAEKVGAGHMQHPHTDVCPRREQDDSHW